MFTNERALLGAAVSPGRFIIIGRWSDPRVVWVDQVESSRRWPLMRVISGDVEDFSMRRQNLNASNYEIIDCLHVNATWHVATQRENLYLKLLFLLFCSSLKFLQYQMFLL